MKISIRSISILLVFLLIFNLNISLASEYTNEDYVSLIDTTVAECESETALNALKSPLDDGTVQRSIDYSYKHSGSGAVKITTTASSYLPLIAFKPTTKLVVGKNYYFSVWYNDANNSAGNTVFEFVGRTSSGISISNKKLYSTGGWKKYECSFNVSGNFSDFVNSLNYFYIRANGFVGSIYFDDITFREINDDEAYISMIDSDVAACENNYAIDVFNTYTVGSQVRSCDNAEYHSGSGSTKVSVTSANLSYIGFKPTTNLIEGEVYYFSVWYKDSRQNVEGKLELRGRNGENKAIIMSQTAQEIKSNGWTKYECVFTATYEIAADLTFFYITSNSDESRYMYFDDITLSKVNPYNSMIDPNVSDCETNYALNSFKSNTVSSDTITRVIDNSNFHSGNGSLKVTLDGNYKSYVGIKPVIKMISGEKYCFSVWYYNPENITGTMYLRYAYPNINNIGNWITGTSPSDTDCGRSLAPGWNRYVYTFTADEKIASDDFKYFYLTTTANNGTLYFDDISLMQIPSEETTLVSQNVLNGDLIEADKKFEFTFNHQINSSVLSDVEIYLNGAIRYDVNVSLSADAKTLTVWFGTMLQQGKDYTLNIRNLNDAWGRKVNINAVNFKTVGQFGIDYNIYSVVDGQKVDFCGELGGTIDVTVDISNGRLDSQNVELCLAEYKDAELVNLTISKEMTVYSGQSKQIDLVLDTSEGNRVRLFTFDSFGHLKSIAPVKTIFPENESDKNGNNVAKYLIDDIQTGAILYDSKVRPSGWDVNCDGGSITNKAGTFVVLDDTSTTESVTMQKEFSSKIDGNVTLETAFSLSSTDSNLYIQMNGGESSALKIVTQGQYICYENTNGLLKVLGKFSSNQMIGLKVAFNIDNQTAYVYINGLFCGNVPFKDKTDYLDRINIATSNEGVAKASIGFVKVYENYILNESFSTTANGNVPTVFACEGDVETFVESNVSTNNDKYLKLSGEESSVKYEFDNNSNKLYGSYKFLIKDDTDGVNVNIGNGISLNADNGNLYCNGTNIYSYKDNIWYQADFEIDTYKKTLQLTLNGKILLQNETLSNNDKPNSIEFVSNGEVWLDDITLFDKKADYSVPPIQENSPDDYIVGMQTYFMWHEGTHYGWDRISPYPERKPYLGWYTDGSPEVSDWEIKWMSEHGIDYEIFPWARNDSNKNAPVKRPIRSDALHDGYFNAKNSDHMRFALMWSMISNSTFGGSDDFRNNIVPYWLEYYFNDPRYMLIDNKPFLSIYDYGNLVSILGSDEAVKNEIDYLRDECINAGFDGIYLAIITSETDSTSEFSRISSIGADAVYPYHWVYGSNTSKYQIESIKRQTEKNTETDTIPYISMGWNPQPWLGMPGEFCSLDDYEAVLNYSKNQVDSLKESGKIDNKLVIVGNWNEYGEGHFVMPSGVEGFGYLDAIKKVFTVNGDESHTDDVPTEKQINSMGYLYKQDRVGEKVIPEPADISDYTTVIKSWDFNSLIPSLEWTTASIKNLSSRNGILSGESTGIDPVIVLKNDLNLDITDADYVKVRMRLTDSTSCTASVMFTTDTNPDWGNSKYTSFGVYHDGFYDYYVYMKSNSRWNGTLKKIRIDPMESAGKFEIDSIQILKK